MARARQLTHTTAQERKTQSRAAKIWRGLVDTTVITDHSVQVMQPRMVNDNFDVSQQVATALRALRDTGLFGNGIDCASVAEELLRRTLLTPEILLYWKGKT